MKLLNYFLEEHGPLYQGLLKALNPGLMSCLSGVSPDEENLKSWFDSVHFVGMGSKLISKEIIKKRNYSKLKMMCKMCIM